MCRFLWSNTLTFVLAWNFPSLKSQLYSNIVVLLLFLAWWIIYAMLFFISPPPFVTAGLRSTVHSETEIHFPKRQHALAAFLFFPLPPPGHHIFWRWRKMNILYCLFTAQEHLVRTDCTHILFKNQGMARCVGVWWLSAVAAQFKGFILYNNRQTDGASSRAHPPDVESDTLQCLCCLSAAWSYTIHTLTRRQHTCMYIHEQ